MRSLAASGESGQGHRKVHKGFFPGVIRAVSGISTKPQPPDPLLRGVLKQRMEKGVTSSAISL